MSRLITPPPGGIRSQEESLPPPHPSPPLVLVYRFFRNWVHGYGPVGADDRGQGGVMNRGMSRSITPPPSRPRSSAPTGPMTVLYQF